MRKSQSKNAPAVHGSPIHFRFIGRLHLSLLIFFVGLFFTFVLWDVYFNSRDPLDRMLVANTVLAMGVLFSISSGLFAWSIETRRDFLERELKIKTGELHQKYRDSRKSDAASAAIYQSCHYLFSETNLETLFEKIMELITKVLGADEGSLMLLDSTDHLIIAASRGLPAEIISQVRIKIGEKVAGRVAEMKRDFLIVDGVENYPEFKGIESNSRIRSSIVCPLLYQNELLGVLNLNRTVNTENFTVTDMLNVSIFAAQVAQAIRNASLYRALERKMHQLEDSDQKVQNLEHRLGIR